MAPSDRVLRSRLIRLASARPEFRERLLPLLKEAGTAKKAKIQGFDGLVSAVEKFSRDLMEFSSQITEDAKNAPADYVKRYDAVKKEMLKAQSALKDLRVEADATADAIERDRKKA